MSNAADHSSQHEAQPRRTLSRHAVTGMAFLHDGKRLVGSWDKMIRIWNIADGKQERNEIAHPSDVHSLAVTRNGKNIISADDKGVIRVWDVETQELIDEWQRTDEYSLIAISPDDRLVAHGNTTLVVRELNGGNVKQEIDIGGVLFLCFSPDGSKVACARRRHIEVCDVDTGELVHRLEGHKGDIRSLQWSRASDDTEIYTASEDAVRCWDTKRWKQIGKRWRGHTDTINSLSISPDGTKIASGSLDGTVRFWDKSGDPVGQPLQLQDFVQTVCISPLNDVVAAATYNGMIFVWQLPWSDEAQHASPPSSTSTYLSESATVLSTDVPLLRNIINVSGRCNSLQNTSPLPSPSQLHIVSDYYTTSSLPSPKESSEVIGSDHHSEAVPNETEHEASPHTEQVAASRLTSALDLSPAHDANDSSSFPAPPDLTQYIIKLNDLYLDGGSFGDVYKCRYNSPTGPIEVAVKSFRFKFTLREGKGTAHAVKMVRRELGIWKRLEHPNIVPFFGTATGFGMQGSLSLVSKWMPNGTLQEFLATHDERLHVSHQLQFLWDVANGLEYLHSFPVSPIVHGDLNSNNVLVDGNYIARLTDFGYSTVVGIIPEALTYLQRSTAQPGALRWSAPELILVEEEEKASERTPKSDIYSFGCLSLQVFSGKQPWSEVWEEGMIPVRMSRGQMPKRPASREMEDRHWEFIQRCWSSADERPTAAMLVFAIQDFMSACPQSPSLRDMFPP